MARSWGGSRPAGGRWIYANPSFRLAPTRSEPFFFGASFEPRGKDRWLPLRSPRDANVPPFVFNAAGNYCKWLSTGEGRLIFHGAGNSRGRPLTQRLRGNRHPPNRNSPRIETAEMPIELRIDVAGERRREKRDAKEITSSGIAISSSES